MDWSLIAASVAIGLAMAAPLGPVNLMVIRASLRRGMIGGLSAGAGSLLADTGFAAAAAYGLRPVEHFFAANAIGLNIVGGLLLVVIGIRTARSHVAAADLVGQPDSASAARLWRKAAAAFSATVTNPGTLVGVFAIFGAMTAVLKLDSAPGRPAMVIAGFVTGGAAWWLFLSFAVSLLKTRLSTKILDRINRWTGLLIAAFGFVVLLTLLD